MRIAFIGEKINPVTVKGAENYVKEVSLFMSEMNHDVFIYAVDEDMRKLDQNKKINFIFLPKLLKRSSETFQVLWATLHAAIKKYDVVHYQSKNTFFISKVLKILSKETKIVSSFDLQCDFKNKPKISASENDDKISIAKLNLRHKRYILFSDKLEKRSGAHLLIEAFKKLEDNAKTPNNFKLVFAVKENLDHDYLKYIQTISEERSNVIFIENPTKEKMEQLIVNAYIFVDSSIERTEPSKDLAAAMLCGVTPLVSNIKENADVVGKGGFIFEANSVLELENKLAYLLNRSDEVEKTGIMVKAKIEKEYGWEKIAKKTIEAQKM